MRGQKTGMAAGITSSAAISSGEPNKLIRFISLHADNSIEDFDIIKDIVRARDFSFDYVEYKFSSTKVQHRLIQPGQKEGPRERIEFEEKIDVNSNYKYLRQVLKRIVKEVNNVFLIQINQVKGFPCSIPLILPELFNSKRNVLVSGITSLISSQLISKPDLTFQTIDDTIARNPYLRSKILERVSREKSMQAIAREIKDFYGFPEPIKEKLNNLSVGNKVPLTDEEAITTLLISDLYTRYLPLFKTFEREITNRSLAVPVLANQFNEMTRGIPTEDLIDALRDFLTDDDGEAFASQDNIQLFSYIYKKAQIIDEKRIKVGDHPLTRAELFARLRSVITLTRSQVDPGLWKQCLFFFQHNDPGTVKKENIKTIDYLLEDVYSKLKVHHSASSISLLEIHLIHNIHRFISGKKVLVAPSDLSKHDMEIIQSSVIPILYQPGKSSDQTRTIRLLLGPQANLHHLINPVHTVGRVYGFLMGRRLRENVQTFLKPGLKELLTRFGKNFFSIFYEMAIQETGLPVSRNQFARWLKEKEFFKKPEDLGYIPNEHETNFDPALTANVLLETGNSCFPATYTEKEFAKEFESARDAFNNLVRNMQQDGRGFAKILDGFLSTGKYNLRLVEFREYIKKSTLYSALRDLLLQSCLEIKPKIRELAVNNKIILKTPLDFEPLLLLENIFLLAVEDQMIQVHVIAVPVKTESDLEPVSATFSRNLRIKLQNPTSQMVKELMRANRILKVYQAVYLDYVRHILISILDRQINSTILKIRQRKNQTPNHIRYFFENYEKLFIGNQKNHLLAKLLQYDSKKKTQDAVYSMTLPQILQAAMLYKSASYKLRNYRTTVEQIKATLEEITALKEDYESLTYQKQLNSFCQMISTPVEELNENVLNLIAILARKIRNTVRQNLANKGVLADLYLNWKSLNPSTAENIDFYLPFLREDKRGHEQKLFVEIAKSREILLNIKRRRCLIFSLDTYQEDSFGMLMEVGQFLIERGFDVIKYVEITGLNKEQIELLSRVFYPGHFFQIDRLKSIKRRN